jgi:DnaJ-class molecular chaperone
MPAKNYYVVLGVSRDESPAGIRTAYHELARRMHPDITGPADTSRFQEINEAYEVLSDPDRRRAHDRDFGEPERGTEVPVRHQPPSWPIAPEPISLFGQPEQTKPSFDAFRERYLRNFTGWNVPKAERAESLTLDVALSPAEACCGCTIPVGVPVFGACPECGGTGQVFLFRCLECAARGFWRSSARCTSACRPGSSLGRFWRCRSKCSGSAISIFGCRFRFRTRSEHPPVQFDCGHSFVT